VTKVVSDLLTNVDSGSPSLLLSLDITAAFNIVNHKRLLQRAQDLFGFTVHPILWLKSYLLVHRRFVSMGASKSGVLHQGSVLGPLLFSLFTTRLLARLYRVLANCTTSMLTILSYTHFCTLKLTTCADAVTRWHL